MGEWWVRGRRNPPNDPVGTRVSHGRRGGGFQLAPRKANKEKAFPGSPGKALCGGTELTFRYGAWSLLDSNQRPLRCERSALPTELSDPDCVWDPGTRPGPVRSAFERSKYPHGESNPGFLAENQVS